MGCCISSNKKIPHQPKPPAMPEPDGNNRAPPPPPPPCLEEETVKEVVLSETPLPKPHQNPKDSTTQMPIIQEHKIEAKDLNLIINKHEQEEDQEEISLVSEIYSINESNRDLNYRSPANVPRKRPNAGEKRADSSSRVMTMPVQGRTVPRNVGPTGVRRESGGGSSSRRFMSPATGTAGAVGRRSPGKVTTGRAPGGKLRVENEGKKEVNDSVLVEKSELNESLDNPHVSLECFIFL